MIIKYIYFELIYWWIQNPGYVINYDVVRSTKNGMYTIIAQYKMLFSRGQNRKIFTFRHFDEVGVHFFNLTKFRHFRSVTKISGPV